MARALRIVPGILAIVAGRRHVGQPPAWSRAQPVVVSQAEMLDPFGSSPATLTTHRARLARNERTNASAGLQRFAAMPTAYFLNSHGERCGSRATGTCSSS